MKNDPSVMIKNLKEEIRNGLEAYKIYGILKDMIAFNDYKI